LTVTLNKELIKYTGMCLYLKCFKVRKKSEEIIGFGLHEYEIKMITTAWKLE